MEEFVIAKELERFPRSSSLRPARELTDSWVFVALMERFNVKLLTRYDLWFPEGTKVIDAKNLPGETRVTLNIKGTKHKCIVENDPRFFELQNFFERGPGKEKRGKGVHWFITFDGNKAVPHPVFSGEHGDSVRLEMASAERLMSVICKINKLAWPLKIKPLPDVVVIYVDDQVNKLLAEVCPQQWSPIVPTRFGFSKEVLQWRRRLVVALKT